MIRRLASFISLLMNPLLMPTILFAILFFLTAYTGNTMSNTQMLYILVIIFSTTFVLPASCVVVLKITQNISNYSLRNRRERFVPFIFISLFYIITTYLFLTRIRLHSLFLVVMIAITALIVAITLITLFWRISAQSAAVCGLIGFLMAITYKFPQDKLLFPLIILILLAGASMSSKLYLNTNEPREVFWGGFLGFLFCYNAIYFFA